MWHKTFRVLWYLAFVYIAVLGWRAHSFAWIIAPAFSMACLLIAQTYLARRYPAERYPGFASKVNAALVVLMVAYNGVFTVWPRVVNTFPWTTTFLDRAKTRWDIEEALQLNAGTAKAQEALIAYLRDSADAEAEDLKRRLDELVQRRRAGSFGPEDERQEAALLDRFRRLAERTESLRKLIAEPISTPNAGRAAAPSQVISDVSRTSAEADARRADPQLAGRRRADPVDEQRQRPADFRRMLNPISVVAGKHNVAIMIATPVLASGFNPDQALYGYLKLGQVHLITDLFRPGFLARGYFDDLYQGDKQLINLAAIAPGIDALIIGRLAYSFRKSNEVDAALVSCDLTLSCKVINRVGDVSRSDSFRVVGPGFSESAALDRGIELLADQFSERMLKPLL